MSPSKDAILRVTIAPTLVLGLLLTSCTQDATPPGGPSDPAAVERPDITIHGDRSGAEEAFRRGLRSIRERDPDAAAARLREAVHLDPTFAEAQFALGKVLVYLADVVVGTPTRDLGTLDEAIRALNFAVGAAPEDANRRWWLGQALRDRGRQEEAIEAFQAALRLDPHHAGAQRDLAFLMADMGIAGAGDEATKALELLPEDATLWFLLGMEREADDDLAGAHDAYAKAIALDWTIPSPYSKLAVVLAREGNMEASEEAQEAYRAWYAYGPVLRARHLEANAKPHDADILVWLADVQLRGQRFELARTTLERALAATPRDPSILHRIEEVEALSAKGVETSASGFVLPLPAPTDPTSAASEEAKGSR